MKVVVSLPRFVWSSFLSVVSGDLCLRHSGLGLVCLQPQLEGSIQSLILSESGKWREHLEVLHTFIICLPTVCKFLQVCQCDSSCE